MEYIFPLVCDMNAVLHHDLKHTKLLTIVSHLHGNIVLMYHILGSQQTCFASFH